MIDDSVMVAKVSNNEHEDNDAWSARAKPPLEKVNQYSHTHASYKFNQPPQHEVIIYHHVCYGECDGLCIGGDYH